MATITHNNVQLTSAEMAALWTAYINNTMAFHVTRYFLQHAQDPNIKALVQESNDMSSQYISEIAAIMKGENFPLPVGFRDEDVRLDAPRAFGETFYLMYNRQMAKMGLLSYSGFLSLMSRSDIISLFKTALKQTIGLYEKSTKMSIHKGVHVRAPYLNIPNEVDFIEDKDYLGGGFQLFSKDKRPLNAIEISHLHTNTESNLLALMLCTVFAQMARQADVKAFLVRGKEIAQKNLKLFAQTLIDSEIQAPMSWDSTVTDTTIPCFSDKLIMFHMTFLGAAGISNYGTAIGASARADVAAEYMKMTAEMMSYAKEGAEIMIKHGWLEEPPQAADRKRLIGQL